MIPTIARPPSTGGTEREDHESHRLRRRRASPAPAPDPVRHLYDGASRRYARYRDRWLSVAGDDAETAMLDDLAGALRPGQRVLDAGSGTGVMSRHILRLCPDVTLTVLDLSSGMLDQAASVGAPRINASIVELPFPDATFDVVVAAWVIETVTVPRLAVTELLRVLVPDGRLFYTFCSQPSGWSARLGSLPLRGIVRWGFAGRFLDSRRTPWHDCAASHRRRFHRGLVTGSPSGNAAPWRRPTCPKRPVHSPTGSHRGMPPANLGVSGRRSEPGQVVSRGDLDDWGSDGADDPR